MGVVETQTFKDQNSYADFGTEKMKEGYFIRGFEKIDGTFRIDYVKTEPAEEAEDGN